MKGVLAPIKDIMPEEAYNEIIYFLGIKLKWNDQLLADSFSWIYLILLTIILLGLVFKLNQKSQS